MGDVDFKALDDMPHMTEHMLRGRGHCIIDKACTMAGARGAATSILTVSAWILHDAWFPICQACSISSSPRRY